MTFIPAARAASNTNHWATMLVELNGSSCWSTIVASTCSKRSRVGRTSVSSICAWAATRSIQPRSDTDSSGGT